MTKKTGKILEVGDFTTVQDSVLAENGIKKGDTIYLAGDMVVPHDEEDPYALRRLFVGAKVDKKGHILVNEGAFTVDGKRLKKVTKARAEKLQAIRKEDFEYINEEVGDED